MSASISKLVLSRVRAAARAAADHLEQGDTLDVAEKLQQIEIECQVVLDEARHANPSAARAEPPLPRSAFSVDARRFGPD